MDMFEEAKTIRSMIEMCGLTQVEIAQKMGVSQSYVANKIRLLGFSERIREEIITGGLSERHARLLLKLDGEDEIFAAIEKIKAMHLLVAASEVLIDGMVMEAMPKAICTAPDRIAKFEEMISESVNNLRSLGIKVKRKTDIYGGKKYITVCIEE